MALSAGALEEGLVLNPRSDGAQHASAEPRRRMSGAAVAGKHARTYRVAAFPPPAAPARRRPPAAGGGKSGGARISPTTSSRAEACSTCWTCTPRARRRI
jgi:hypothetical protein